MCLDNTVHIVFVVTQQNSASFGSVFTYNNSTAVIPVFVKFFCHNNYPFEFNNKQYLYIVGVQTYKYFNIYIKLIQ